MFKRKERDLSSIKPLNVKAYGSIPHLSGSKMDQSDKKVSYAEERILTVKTRDSEDVIITTEKVDGACVAVTKVNGIIIALSRAGYPAYTSPYKQHHIFNNWVFESRNLDRFVAALEDGERIVGEWMLQAHGTRYNIPHEPFIVFDYFFSDNSRMCYLDFLEDKVHRHDFIPVKLISYGPSISIDEAMSRAKISGHGAIDKVEGVVWRCEKNGNVDFLAKYVRGDKEDGLYLPERNSEYTEPTWNTFPGVEKYIKKDE